MRLADLMGPQELRVFVEVRQRHGSSVVTSHSLKLHTRFIRAVKWASAQASIKRIEATLKWRREFGVYDLITASHVEPEVNTHILVQMDVV